MRDVKPPRALLSVTFAILFALSSLVYFYSKSQLPPSIQLETQGQPTIGYAQARVHVVVFEEPKCSHCRDLNIELFPSLKKEYIDTNKIQLTLVPVSFLPGSMPAAEAALCVYNQNARYPNNELFFKYVDYMYRHQTHGNWATTQNLVNFARATSPAIELDQLRHGIETEEYRVQIEQNTDYAKHILGGKATTPAIFVNGIQVREMSVDGIVKLIKLVLKHEGID